MYTGHTGLPTTTDRSQDQFHALVRPRVTCHLRCVLITIFKTYTTPDDRIDDELVRCLDGATVLAVVIGKVNATVDLFYVVLIINRRQGYDQFEGA